MINRKYGINNNQVAFKGNNLKKTEKLVDIAKSSIKEIKDLSVSSQEDCWKLYEPNVLERFIKSDKELEDSMEDMLSRSREYGVKFSLPFLVKMCEHSPNIKKFFDIVKTKYNIDLKVPPKVYRFVSEPEVQTLKNNKIVRPNGIVNDRFDVTLNPNLNWGQSEYRITFMPKKEFSVLDGRSNMRENPGVNHEYFYHYMAPYTIDDVEMIEKFRT